MKVKELRALLSQHTRDDLELIAEKLYRLIPAAQREKKDVDLLVENPSRFVQSTKRRKEPTMDPIDAIYDAKDFLENAKEGNYFAPNRTISKKQRSQWRFAAKKIYLGLTQACNIPEYREEAAKLLEEMFLLLCKATQVYIFASTEPFQTIGVPIADFLRQALLGIRGDILTDDWARRALDLTAYSMHIKYYSLDLVAVVMDLFPTAPAREMVIDLGKRLLNVRKVPKVQDPYIAILLFHLQLAQKDVESAIKDFKEVSKRYERRNAIFYRTLQILKAENYPKEWMSEYEKGLKEGIKPWSDMESTYQQILETGQF